MTENNTITCEKFLPPHAPAAVWKALTDPHLHARWWAAGGHQAGGRAPFHPRHGILRPAACEVTEVDDERLLSFRFAEGSLDTTITWTLRPEGAGTRLVLVHSGFDLDSPMGRQAYEGMGKGGGLMSWTTSAPSSVKPPDPAGPMTVCRTEVPEGGHRSGHWIRSVRGC